jgi:hypothetical protein
MVSVCEAVVALFGVLFVLCRILELKAAGLICVWQANRGKTWELTYFLIAVCHRTLYLSVQCGYERLLREYTSDRELIYEFVASRVHGCKTERADARLRSAR